MAGKKTQLELLKAKGALIGLDVEALENEIVEKVVSRLPVPPAVDEDALAEKVRVKVETVVALKLDEVLEAMKQSADGSKPDSESIIKGVVRFLQPQIEEATKQANEAVKAVNSFVQQAEERLKLQADNSNSDGSNPPNRTGFGLDFSGLGDLLIKGIEAWAKLRPQQQNVALADALSRMYRFNKLFDDLKKADVDADTFDKKVHESFTKKTQ